MSIKLTIMCENSVRNTSKFIGEHGFSCFVETNNNKLLFDTGQGLGIIHNSLVLKKDLRGIDSIVLSHGHWDHANGIEKVLNITGKRKVFAHPDIFKKKYSKDDGIAKYSGIKFEKEHLLTIGADFILKTEFNEIFKDVYLTGEIPQTNDFETQLATKILYDDSEKEVVDPFMDDNSLILDTPKGLVVVLGCAHRGIVNILNYAVSKLNKNIYAVIGGTHLHPVSEERFEKTVQVLKDFDIQKIGVSHCTGLPRAAKLYNIFKDRFFFASVGIEFIA